MSRRGWLLGLIAGASLTTAGVLMAGHNTTAKAGPDDECVRACNECRAACLAWGDHCLGLKGEEDCIRTCLDCADICGTCSSVSARNGPMASVIARACAQACEKCAGECGDGDEVMKACAEKCRTCAELCKAEAGA